MINHPGAIGIIEFARPFAVVGIQTGLHHRCVQSEQFKQSSGRPRRDRVLFNCGDAATEARQYQEIAAGPASHVQHLLVLQARRQHP